MTVNIKDLIAGTPVVEKIIAAEEAVWINPDLLPFAKAARDMELSMADIDDAEARLKRFEPFIMKCFPETRERNGMIESELVEVPGMKRRLNAEYSSGLKGKLLLKKDSHLAISGSVKARGGIYEVLKHAEALALEHGVICKEDSYDKLAEEESRKFFSRYTVQVGSTGNLGMSIGIMSAAVGFQAVVHMSADAKAWKKELLRSRGVKVVEYDSDYSLAVAQGRKESDENPNSYFVDDENSRDLFLGYAVAAKRLVGQLQDHGISVDQDHPLFVYVPCGVGGAPGGITFGLKQVFGDHVHCFFVEPTQAPCMLLGMATGLNNEISVTDVGLSGITHADGLAVGRPSGFVGSVMKTLLSGISTINDKILYDFMRNLLEEDEIFLEPSACAAFAGPARLMSSESTLSYIGEQGLAEKMENGTHIAWATGGSMVPEEIREEYKNTYL